MSERERASVDAEVLEALEFVPVCESAAGCGRPVVWLGRLACCGRPLLVCAEHRAALALWVTTWGRSALDDGGCRGRVGSVSWEPYEGGGRRG